jgi:hypothetical protein
MDTKTLSKSEASEIQKTLDLARSGKATLAQLAVAHDLAVNGTLNSCIGEIRAHIRRTVTPPPWHMEGKEILLGVASGFLTHFLLRKWS